MRALSLLAHASWHIPIRKSAPCGTRMTHRNTKASASHGGATPALHGRPLSHSSRFKLSISPSVSRRGGRRPHVHDVLRQSDVRHGAARPSRAIPGRGPKLDGRQYAPETCFLRCAALVFSRAFAHRRCLLLPLPPLVLPLCLWPRSRRPSLALPARLLFSPKTTQAALSLCFASFQTIRASPLHLCGPAEP